MNSKSVEKKALIESLLSDEYLLLHVNLTHPKVVAPKHLHVDQSATFKISHHFPGAILVTDEAVSAQLLFDSNYFDCLFPMEAIWAVSDSKGQNSMWLEFAPEKILVEILKSSNKLTMKDNAAKEKTFQTQNSEETSIDTENIEKKNAKKAALPQRGHLRRIK